MYCSSSLIRRILQRLTYQPAFIQTPTKFLNTNPSRLDSGEGWEEMVAGKEGLARNYCRLA